MHTVGDGPLSRADEQAPPRMGYTAISAQKCALDDGSKMGLLGSTYYRTILLVNVSTTASTFKYSQIVITAYEIPIRFWQRLNGEHHSVILVNDKSSIDSIETSLIPSQIHL
jgi:hypothetical protein